MLIEVKNLIMDYDRRRVVEDVSFTIDEGDYVCIVGENGTGKSTLMKGLLGLLPPAGGEIKLHGLRRNQIGYLPQQTPVQRDFPASVYEVVLSGRLSSCGARPFYSRDDRFIATESMKLLDILDLKDKCYRELSGGQQQRVLMARALCAGERLLVLDEPMASLDPVVTQQLYGIIRHLNRHHGVTVLMVSHDIHGAVNQASKVIHMNGRMEFCGSVADYLKTDLCKCMMGEDDCCDCN
jgi:zinc transport system ATP-binding protein